MKVLKGQGIKKHGLAFLSGPKQVWEVLKDFPDRCAGLVVTKKQDAPRESIPDQITIYQDPILALSRDPDQIKRQVRQTVIHELGHYFGLSDEEMADLERE